MTFERHIVATNCLTSHFLDINLSKVQSFEKKQELLNILHSENPSHNQRLWLVGFLKYVNYSVEEICAIINAEASWGGYNAIMTYNQVSSVFRLSGRHGSGGTSISSQSSRAWIKRDEWEKRYGKRLCTLHYVSCANCPDNMGQGKPCRGRI